MTLSEQQAELEQALHPRHTALLIHDMQNDFCTPEGKIYRRAAKRPETLVAVMETVARLAQAARAAGVKLVYLQQMHLPNLADIPRAHVNHLRKNGLGACACNGEQEEMRGRRLAASETGHGIILVPLPA